jgi:hypothetical protein
MCRQEAESSRAWTGWSGATIARPFRQRLARGTNRPPEPAVAGDDGGLPQARLRLARRRGRVALLRERTTGHRDQLHDRRLLIRSCLRRDEILDESSSRFRLLTGWRFTWSMPAIAVMRSLSSCFEVTRMWRKTDRANLEKNVAPRFANRKTRNPPSNHGFHDAWFHGTDRLVRRQST